MPTRRPRRRCRLLRTRRQPDLVGFYARIVNTQFLGLRAKALTDADERDGIQAAQPLGGHTTQPQTADYIRYKNAIKAKACRRGVRRSPNG
jgi:hypothetical protein